MAVSCRFALLLLAAAACGAAAHAKKARKPNIIWVLTDDQDQWLGGSFPIADFNKGVTPMPKTKQALAEAGSTATNFFIHTPICNPSRSSLLSGRYYHNIKGVNLTDAEMHINEPLVNNQTFARYLKEQGGYTVGSFGKYQNQMPKTVPPGFDAFMGNGGGDYMNPKWNLVSNITADLYPPNGMPDGKPFTCTGGYTTAVVGNVSGAWIRKVVAEDPSRPFMAYVAPKAAHEPFNPAPWYEGHWDPSWPAHEPRPAPWNSTAAQRKGHANVVPDNGMITEEAAAVITDVFKNRWRTLMSVDDLIEDLVQVCADLGILNNTYVFYSSDHGFQLGEFNILMDKRHVYDWDTHIHLLSRGPGIAPNSTWEQPATQVDMAPTFLGIAGLPKPAQMDGKSLMPLLVSSETDASELPESVAKHLESLGPREEYVASWRDQVFIEYYYNALNTKCVADCKALTPDEEYPTKDSSCGDLTPGKNSECWSPDCTTDCYVTEDSRNNFRAIRSMPGSKFGDVLFAEYQTGLQSVRDLNFTEIDFVELFDVEAGDVWQMHNVATNTTRPVADYHKQLELWYSCTGDACP